MKFGGFDVDVGWDLVGDNYDNLYVTGYYQNFTEFDASLLEDDFDSEILDFSLLITMSVLDCGIGLRTLTAMSFSTLSGS